MGETKSSYEPCPSFGKGWDVKSKDCKDCKVDYLDEYERCKTVCTKVPEAPANLAQPVVEVATAPPATEAESVKETEAVVDTEKVEEPGPISAEESGGVKTERAPAKDPTTGKRRGVRVGFYKMAVELVEKNLPSGPITEAYVAAGYERPYAERRTKSVIHTAIRRLKRAGKPIPPLYQ